MKKFISSLFILVYLTSNIVTSSVVATATTTTSYKEGIYQLSNLNITPKNRYTVQNISTDSSVYVALFDENQLQIQSIYLSPNSKNYSLIPLEPSYRIVIVGKGEVIIA